MFEKIREFLSDRWNEQKAAYTDKHGAVESLTGIATSLVILGVVGAVGVYIMNEVFTIAAVTGGSQFYTAMTKVVAIINTGFGLLVIAVLALISLSFVKEAVRGYSRSNNSISYRRIFFKVTSYFNILKERNRWSWRRSVLNNVEAKAITS